MKLLGIFLGYLASLALLVGGALAGGVLLVQYSWFEPADAGAKPVIPPKIADFLARKNEPWPQENPEPVRAAATVVTAPAPKVIVHLPFPDASKAARKKPKAPRGLAATNPPFEEMRQAGSAAPWFSYRDERHD